MAPGSYLAISHPANDVEVPGAAGARLGRLQVGGLSLRSRGEVARFFDGLELVEPGLVQPQRWRPDPDEKGPAGEVTIWCGVARKP